MKITAEDILALKPCWSKTRVRNSVGKGVTPLQIARASEETIADRRWILTRLLARTESGRNSLVQWAAGCAQDVVNLIADEDTRDAASVCIAMSVSWSEGVEITREAMDEVRRDMWDRYYAAASAAYAAAAAAASAAANADAAASAATTAAAYAADAADAAAQKQLISLAAYLNKE